MAIQNDIERRVSDFRSSLDVLIEADKHAGESRFFLSADREHITQQVQSELGRIAVATAHSISPFFLLVAGESASGKTTLSLAWNRILHNLGGATESLVERSWSQCISLDSYYRDNSTERAKYTDLSSFYMNFNVDNPDALDLELAAQHINLLSQGQIARAPQHDITTGRSSMEAVELQPTRFVIVEGLFALHDHLTTHLDDIKGIQVFTSTTPQENRRRWFARIAHMGDTVGWKVPEAGRPLYFERVRSAAEEYILPAAEFADVVVNGEASEDYRDTRLTQLSEIMIRAMVG